METLKRDATGAEVAKLQTRLKERGFDPGSIDENFGGGTEAAVIAFQRSEGLLADGGVEAHVGGAGIAREIETPNVIPGVTVAAVSQMFPHTPVGNIKRNLPPRADRARRRKADGQADGVDGARDDTRGDRELRARRGGPVALQHLAQRASLRPLRQPARPRQPGKPDGERYRGRGYIQLTGRHNYGDYGAVIGLTTQLVETPELASDPAVAGRLLTAFLADKEARIRQALIDNDLPGARRLVTAGATAWTGSPKPMSSASA